MNARGNMTMAVMSTKDAGMTAPALSMAGAIIGLMVTVNGCMLRRRLSMHRPSAGHQYLFAIWSLKVIASGQLFIADPKQLQCFISFYRVASSGERSIDVDHGLNYFR